MRNTLPALLRNPISQLGSALATVSVILFVTIMLIELLGSEGHPYVGIITYLILPAIFVFGVILIPLGIRRERRRSGTDIAYPNIDLNSAQTRKRIALFLVLIAGSTVILAAATFKGLEVMESNAFCGEACHSVMSPEYTVYQRSPHSRVKCVECHVGSGTEWLIKTKLNGAWQMISVTLDLYPRPIPTPVHNLRPAGGTCEHCHWPENFVGTRARMTTRFSEDEQSTELKTILLMNIGGNDFRESRGIHWHADARTQIRYRSDLQRETIYDVELTLEDGSVKHWSSGEPPADQETEWRRMDCIDCHNRPTHIYYGAAEAVDLALEREFIARDLPFIKREAVIAIKKDYDSHEAAKRGIAADVDGFYREEYPDLATQRAGDIAEAGRILGVVYANNVYPTMKIGWDTYPDHIGHEKGPGCFRCHSGSHITDDGETISDECEDCHALVAMDEASPDILKMLP